MSTSTAEQEELLLELDRALRRIRSTGDLEYSSARPSRQRTPLDRRSDGGNATLMIPMSPRRAQGMVVPPTPAHTRGTGLRSPTDPSHNERAQAVGPTPRPRRRRPTRPVPNGFKGKVLVFFGLAGPNAKARSQVVTVLWKLAWGFTQFAFIISLLVVASKRDSPTMPGVKEWTACNKPLGTWNAIWLVRVAFASLLAYWEWRRQLAVQRIEDAGDAETARSGRIAASGSSRTGLPPDTTFALGHSESSPSRSQTEEENKIENQLPNTHAFRRLSAVTNMLSLVWFLTAHVLEYSSVNECRHAAPHLWWLTFGILCILYLMILEIFLIGLLVFILGPVLYLVYNLALLCLGRHPLQHPDQIKADIKKLPKTIVEQIPLVLYIPSPPEEESKAPTSPITVLSAAHLYPPKSPTKSSVRKRRFAFFRRSKNGKGNGSEKAGGKNGDDDAKTWEDNWVPGEYPFVRLEGHRAACAICLMDFDEPERKTKGKKEADDQEKAPSSPIPPRLSPNAPVQEVQVEEVTQADAERLKLEDAGDGPQPLRLLACGHVFHQTCVDPWLIDVSGRCPVCQRPVEIPEDPPKKRGNRRTPSS